MTVLLFEMRACNQNAKTLPPFAMRTRASRRMVVRAVMGVEPEELKRKLKARIYKIAASLRGTLATKDEKMEVESIISSLQVC